MFIIDNAHKCRLLAVSHSFVCARQHAGATDLGSPRLHQAERPAGAAPATAPPGLSVLSVDPISPSQSSFFARRKVFQRNTCECLKGGEMTAEAERQGYLLSIENMSRWKGGGR